MNQRFTELPSGTLTFLFTDIQGSTELLKQLGEAYANLLSDQRQILRAAFEKWDGREIDTQGDAFFASFPRATQAVAAVVEIQRALAAHDWPSGVEVRVRMGLHTGEPWLVEEGYVGMDVHRAARIAHVAHGGQVLLSGTTTPLVQDELPEGVDLLDLGLHRLIDLHRPEHIHQLVIDGLPSDFPALKAKLVKPPVEASRPKPAALPAFLGDNAQKTIVEAPVFVSRQVELEKLDGFLEKALTGQGRVVFLSGGPGRGKTAMIDHFARRSMEKHNDLLVISGGCDAYTGSGDPFRPFRAALGMLAGDLESRWAGGALTTDHARRLWDVVPITGAAIMEGSKDLLGTFFNATDLSKRAESAGHTDQDWYLELQTYLEEAPRAGSGLGKAGLLEQIARVLRSVAEIRPLILTLDDLQWADSASLDLLVHLDRELNGVRMLILGAYRPEEVALGRDGGRHPLEKVLAEFKRQYGDMQIELDVEDERGGRDFIDALLDTEPNHLSDDFRGALYKQTAGHPLFTVELLREMQTRGDLIRDENNSWIAGPALNWNVLPARVEGVIEERIGRLEEALRETLTIASVEGEDFTAQVVARVQQVKDQGIIRQLSRELDKKHRLVGEQASQQIGAIRMHRYRFRHSLFQQHLYNGLTENEKEFLHADVGAVLEELYGKSREQMAPQLAWHFDEAGQRGKAIDYYLQAGDQARWFYAQAEAAQHYQNAADLLKGGDNDRRMARTLIKLGQAYHSLPDYRRAQQAYQEGFLIWEHIRKKGRLSTPTNITATLRADWDDPLSLDPTRAGDDSDLAVLKQLFSGLVRLNPEDDVIPEVARAWDIEENGKRYIFHLREDVQWSDGSPLTAGDFEFALATGQFHVRSKV